MSTHSPTLPSPPRQVSERAQNRFFGWLERAFCYTLAAASVITFFYALAMVLWALYGTELPGTITGGSPATHGRGSSSAVIRFAYQADGPRTGSSNVSDAVYAAYVDHGKPVSGREPVILRHLQIGPLHIAGLYYLEARWWECSFYCTISILTFAFFYSSWLRPRRAIPLCRVGLETSGQITRLTKKIGRYRDYSVRYSFTDHAGIKHSGKTITDYGQWKTAKIGQTVRVLYAASKPRRSVAYDFCLYQIVGDNTVPL